MTDRKLKFWGWGFEGEGPDETATGKIAAALAQRFGIEKVEVATPPRIEEIALRPPRVEPPASLRETVSDDPHERARHSYGRSYRDLVRAFRRDFSEPPDWVAFPRDESAVVDLLDWCGSKNIAAIPFGGGSSVVGGVGHSGAEEVHVVEGGGACADHLQACKPGPPVHVVRRQFGLHGPDAV